MMLFSLTAASSCRRSQGCSHCAPYWRYSFRTSLVIRPLVLAGGGDLPFVPTIEDVVENSLFSCFENGYGDNVVLEDSGISVRELMNFQCSTNPVIVRSLNKISAYMNDHAVELTDIFLYAPPEDVKSICRNILENSKLKSIISARNLPLYLASINEGLMELQDYFAFTPIMGKRCWFKIKNNS